VIAVDAAHGFAFPALDAALAALPDVARSQGIAAAPIRRSHHCGAAGHAVERLAAQGIVVSSSPIRRRRSRPGAAAKACSARTRSPLPAPCPTGADRRRSFPLEVARGNILAAKQRGERIPDDWALDETGRPTSDPEAALKGTMLPLGDAKGTALALMVELLAAGLTGASYAADASSFLDDKGGPPGPAS
jgi:(2R)-3-sulfolactate dehydrogenase (NADP+)